MHGDQSCRVVSSNTSPLQWNLRITDTFGTLAILSFVEKLSFIGTIIRTIGKSLFSTLNLVLCSEVISIVSFIGGSTV